MPPYSKLSDDSFPAADQLPCNGLTIGLDGPGDVSFLSHAHSDHSSGLKRQQRIIASPETMELAGFDMSRSTSLEPVKLLDAGHILGSRQLIADCDGGLVAYTGDISLKPNVFGWKAEIPRCDRLIIEATYGDPAYRFPPLEDVYSQLHRWIKENSGRNLIIGGYELGKSQELVRMLNENGIAPIVTERTDGFCAVYEKYGVKLDRIVVGSPEAEAAMKHAFAAIVPMAKAKRYFAKRIAEAFERPTVCAVATGWALHYRFDTDAAFALSDHADFDDLVSFVEQSGAKDVEFFCGNGRRVLEAVNGAILNV